MTTKADLRPGDVVPYPYLWKWQDRRGETEGRKDRPVCVAVCVRARDGLTHVALLAISSRPGDAGQLTLEIPPIERRRAGLRAFKDAWVALDEFNYDIVEKSHYLDPSQAALGRFSKSFMMQVAKRLAPAFASKGARIDRL